MIRNTDSRALCWACDRVYAVNGDGLMRTHSTTGMRGDPTCEGSGTPVPHRLSNPCGECGAALGNIGLHRLWHEHIDRLIEIAVGVK